MKIVVDTGFKSEYAVSGFKATGLFPLNFDEIVEKRKLNTALKTQANQPIINNIESDSAIVYIPTTDIQDDSMVANTPNTTYQLVNLSNYFKTYSYVFTILLFC